MLKVAKFPPLPRPEVALQPVSEDIWDKKYRLKNKQGQPIDHSIDDTFQRVASALAQAEASPALQAHWFERFVWALQRGAIPAGRITSNAGALEHKPATSTINCTVSGTIEDSMNGILEKVHEAGLTLKAGCGIGYEFSSLRPRGAFVAGAGAYTSGPLSFMDIYDKMCFTVSSAGGRRGAQMATFDIAHPDAIDFIKAKREAGRLRQFNLSCLITEEFMLAVKADADWKLAFPITHSEAAADGIDPLLSQDLVWRDWPIKGRYVTRDDGKVACRVYKTLKARRLWDVIMSSTYDYAEPGFILIDRVNQMNNNWWCENIRATNPCVSADTWVHTAEGPRQVSQLLGQQFVARVNGSEHPSAMEGFFATGVKPVWNLCTAEGYRLTLTADHLIQRVVRFDAEIPVSAWCPAGELRPGDRIILQNHGENPHWPGPHTREEGYLVGWWMSSGGSSAPAQLSFPRPAAQVNAAPDEWAEPDPTVLELIAVAARRLYPTCPSESAHPEWKRVGPGQALTLDLPALEPLLNALELKQSASEIHPALEQAGSEFWRGFLSASFDASGKLSGSTARSSSLRLEYLSGSWLEGLQRILLRLGIVADLHSSHRNSGLGEAGNNDLRNQHPSSPPWATGKPLELSISGRNLVRVVQTIGVNRPRLREQLQRLLSGQIKTLTRERFVAQVAAVQPCGEQPVYDVRIPGLNAFDANGLMAHNCGEQPLPPYGACLLGSINLTNFVRHPFTDQASFDWEEYREVVRIFTRMLDNVVDVNGLPLAQQRAEITRKRRHGMGYLGLGSTLTLLRMTYGSRESLEFTEEVTRVMAEEGWKIGLELAAEKGPAPIMEELFEVTAEMLAKRPEMAQDGISLGDQLSGKVLLGRYSRYLQQFPRALREQIATQGVRFTHHTSIAPTGTISLSLGNNASNGIEPSFAHHYSRNVIREGKKSKEKVDVYSYELLAYRTFVNDQAIPHGEAPQSRLPDYFVDSSTIPARAHVDIQAAAQKWIDSSISKTINVPTDYPYSDFKDIYLYAFEQGLKGCTTFRFNPEAFQGVLVTEQDLEKTTYRFTLEDGSVVEAKGNETIEYDGELHSAANLYDALKEGYYGKF